MSNQCSLEKIVCLARHGLRLKSSTAEPKDTYQIKTYRPQQHASSSYAAIGTALEYLDRFAQQIIEPAEDGRWLHGLRGEVSALFRLCTV